jgi:hypothetical protein
MNRITSIITPIISPIISPRFLPIKSLTFFEDLYKPLGRWNVDYCNLKINRKIELSNEDHCGPCGEISKINSKNFPKK